MFIRLAATYVRLDHGSVPDRNEVQRIGNTVSCVSHISLIFDLSDPDTYVLSLAFRRNVFEVATATGLFAAITLPKASASFSTVSRPPSTTFETSPRWWASVAGKKRAVYTSSWKADDEPTACLKRLSVPMSEAKPMSTSCSYG
jgi:hypothetical protein